MNRELDEIEMGKEGMKYVCDHAKRCTHPSCGNNRPHEHGTACDTGKECTWTGYPHIKVKCIPVEPERVKARWCRYYGRCVLMTGDWCEGLGENTCGAYVTPTPSPGLLQRMGMTVGPSEGDWFVVRETPNGEPAQVIWVSLTEDEARQSAKAWRGRAFRWQDGVQG